MDPLDSDTAAVPVARGPLGLGFVVVGSAEGHTVDSLTIRFYDAPEAGQAVHEVEVNLQAMMDGSHPSRPAWLAPETWWPDAYLFHFRALETRGEWARVVVHEPTGRTLWLRTVPGDLSFVPWDAFLISHVTVVGRDNPGANPLRAAPSPEASRVEIPAGVVDETWTGDCLMPVEVRGDWARVAPSNLCRASYTGEAPSLGWIRWREGDRLVISYGSSC